jgi:hypothetical protein
MSSADNGTDPRDATIAALQAEVNQYKAAEREAFADLPPFIVADELDADCLRDQGYQVFDLASGHPLQRKALTGVQRLIVLQRPGEEGVRFGLQIRAHLQRLRWTGRLIRCGLPDGDWDLATVENRLGPAEFRVYLGTLVGGGLSETLDGTTTDEPREHEEKPSEPWQVFTLADAYRPREPPVEVVEGLFPRPSVSIVYGAPATLKTLLLLDMLACIAAGLTWLRPLNPSHGLPRGVTQASVLWVDFDNGPRRMHERVAAIGRAYGLLPSVPLHYVSMPSPWLDASNPIGLAPLEAALERYEAKVVVIDNLLLIKGSIEENSAGMGVVMAYLRQLAERYDCVVIALHHQRKDQGNGGRSGDRLRGHSSIEAAVDLALLVEREDGSDSITLRSTKTRGADVPPFGAVFTYEHAPGTSDLFKARFYGLPIADEHSDRAVEHAIRAALGASGELRKMDLSGRVHGALPKVGINRIRVIIDRMLTQHHLNMRPGARGSQNVSLPSRGV